MHILSSPQEELFKAERKVLNDLRMVLLRLGTTQEDHEALDQSIQQLDEIFLLVVVGEFNSGKSAIINALLGHKLLKEGVTPTTTEIHILRYGVTEERRITDEHQCVLTSPLDFLAEISIVDTPGTNAIIRQHETITSKFVPRSDLVLFVTSADRPFTESERVFLGHIRDWGKKVIILINKIDILQNGNDLTQVEAFIKDNALKLLGITPEIFPVSARAGLRAKQGEPALWKESGFESLERHIHNILDEQGRLQLKLLNPLGVGTHVVERYLDVITARWQFLQTDLDMLTDVETQLATFKEDMKHDFNFRMSDIEKTLLEMEQRGQDFFDETFRLARVIDLFSKSRVQQEFERKVVGDAPQSIERKVNELIGWMVDANLRQWQAVTEHLAKRHREHQGRIVGDLGTGSFRYDRERLIDSLAREARRIVDTYDKTKEARAIADGAQATVAASAAVEAGALGLGTIVTALASTAAADVTGVLMAGLLAALGLVIIPARRRQGKTKIRDRIMALRAQLIQSLDSRFSQEIDRSLQHINETIAPYTRFVRGEREKLQETQMSLRNIKGEIDGLKAKVEAL
jgi:small GTP-binding protein